ncbi:MAG: hypothetical protein JXR19_04115 [Bacteroidia bacterium]
MPLVRDRQSNFIRFIYTLGAIILLIAALLLILEWPYAKELFGLGLFLEIIVFILSIIEPKNSNIKTNSTYSDSTEFVKPKFTLDLTSKSKNTSEDGHLVDSIEQLSKITSQLSDTVERMHMNYEDSIVRTGVLEQQIEKLSLQLRKTDEKIKSLNDDKS